MTQMTQMTQMTLMSQTSQTGLHNWRKAVNQRKGTKRVLQSPIQTARGLTLLVEGDAVVPIPVESKELQPGEVRRRRARVPRPRFYRRRLKGHVRPLI